MYTSPILIFSTLLGAAVAGGCNHDNCLRAVIGSAFPTRHGVDDCSSFFVTTVTPSTVTVTATSTQINPFTQGVTAVPMRRRRGNPLPGDTLFPVTVDNLRARAVATIPAYASPCSGVARYSSACSCVGVPATIVTLPTPTATVTATTTISSAVATVTAGFTYSQFLDGPGSTCDVPISPPQQILVNSCLSVSAGIKLSLTPFTLGTCVCNFGLYLEPTCTNPFTSGPVNNYQGCLRSGGSGYIKMTCSSC